MRTLCLFLFFLSGLASLIYETVWIKELTLVFGVSTAATAVVVAVYMTGLGLGSLILGRSADRLKNPGKILGLVEIAIGITALIVFLYLGYLRSADRAVSLHNGLIWTLTIVFLLLPSFFMGSTLPLIAKTFIAAGRELGTEVGRLYAVNTLGSIAGVIWTGFWMIKHLGMNLTQVVAIIISLVVGVIFIFIRPSRDASFPATGTINPASEPRAYSRAVKQLLLITTLITGLIGLGCEILWIRTLSVFLANSTYTFTIALAIYLAGISLGSYLYTRLRRSIKPGLSLLAAIQGISGGYMILMAAFITRLPKILFLLSSIMGNPLARIVVPVLILGIIIMLVPTIMAGLSFPLICQIYALDDRAQPGRDISIVYFLNTIGSMLGPLFAGFILIPGLGVVKSMAVFGFLAVILGIVILARAPKIRISKKAVFLQGIISVSSLVLGFVSMHNTILLPPSFLLTRERSGRILFYRETIDGTVIASEDPSTKIRSCYINNSAVIGTTYDALKVVKLLGHLPCLVNREAQTALVIGFGVGITTASIAAHPLKNIDCVELCPGVKDAAKYFNFYNSAVYTDPRVKFFAGDGRNHLLATDKKFDIISCDPTHPTLGSGNLYTREFFLLCQRHLNPGGVMCQYLPLHKLSKSEFQTAINTFFSVFDHATIWLAHSHAIIIGTQDRLHIEFADLEAFTRDRRDEILHDPYALAVALLVNEADLARLTRGSRINTDDRPILEYFDPLSLRKENWQQNMALLMAFRTDPNQIFSNIKDQTMLSRYTAGQKYFVRGLIYMNQGDRVKMTAAFDQAKAINPENREIQAFRDF